MMQEKQNIKDVDDVFLVECEDCKTKFNTQETKNGIIHKREFEVKGEKIYLTYYDCPECKRRHFVQVDDEISLKKLSEATELFTALAKESKKGKPITKKQSALFSETRKDLSSYRFSLMKKYVNESIYDDKLKTNFLLRFSI